MNKIPNRQAICETLMEYAKRFRIVSAVFQYLSGPIRRGGHRGTESGEHLRWSRRLRQEALVRLPRQLRLHPQLRAVQGGRAMEPWA